MFSRICTTNNRFKQSRKKGVFERILICKQKTFTIFLRTIHGSHRESKLGLERLKKWGFAWIIRKFEFRQKKGMTPHWPPIPTSRGTNQPKRYCRSRKPEKFIWFLLHFVSVVTKRNSLVDVHPGLKSRRPAFGAK